MSLYGALFAGVSGLGAESSAMGAISNNISNVNTIGYKGTDVNFSTLVTHQVSTTQFSPGGVEGAPRQAVDVQGLLQSTSSSTDMSVSGQGFFVVNSVAQPAAQGGGEFAYTRAGSFIPDQNGFLQNASGFYLQGWPLVPTDNSTASQASNININGTTFMTAYKTPNGTFHYINQNIVSDTELQPFNINTIGGTAEATTNVSLGANLPSGDPVFNPNNTSAGGIHESNVLLFDSLGDSENALFTFTKQAANAWSLNVAPPAGAAVATLVNNSSAVAGPLVYGAAGQLEFNSIPPANSYFQISSGTTSSTNPVVQIQFFDSSKGQSNPTADTPATVNGVSNVSILGVDLNGVASTTDVTAAIVKAIQTAANTPHSFSTPQGPTTNIQGVLLGGVSDGANRFVSNGNTVLINQEPGANALKINCASNTTTGLGTSIVESGANEGTEGPAGANLGIFTVPAIWSGGTASEPPTYSQLVPGTTSFTITAATASSMPTGFFQVGNSAISWSDIEAGTNPIPVYTVDNTTSPPTYNSDDTVTLSNPPAAAATDPLSAAQNLQTILGELSGTSTTTSGASFTAFSNLTVSSVSGTTGNATSVTLSDSGTAASIFADASGTNALTGAVQGATGETTYSSNSKDGTTSVLLGPTGKYTTAAIGLTFNGDGTPSQGSNVGQSTALPGIVPTSMSVTWANGAENQVQNPGPNTAQQPQISLNLGSPNETNGMTQLGGTFTVNFLQQNGAKFGTFAGVSIGSNGVITALFNNGVRTPVFQVPLATFPNPDGLESQTGNIFQATTTSGGYTVRQAQTGGSGAVSASALESSTVDIGTQFTSMIVVQRAYSAAAKVITTTDSMLTDLINVIPQ